MTVYTAVALILIALGAWLWFALAPYRKQARELRRRAAASTCLWCAPVTNLNAMPWDCTCARDCGDPQCKHLNVTKGGARSARVDREV